MTLFIVIKIESRLWRLPRNFGVATLALHECLAIKAVGLVAFVAAAAELVFAKVEAAPSFVGLLVAVLAVDNLVLVFKRPTGELVIKALLATLDDFPAHDVKAAPLVLKVAGLAFLALHFGRGVVALARSNAFFKVVVIVAVKALVAIDCLALVDVAVVAVALVVQASVLFGQWPWARGEEVTVRRRSARSKEAQKQGEKPCRRKRNSTKRTSHNNKQILQRLCER